MSSTSPSISYCTAPQRQLPLIIGCFLPSVLGTFAILVPPSSLIVESREITPRQCSAFPGRSLWPGGRFDRFTDLLGKVLGSGVGEARFRPDIDVQPGVAVLAPVVSPGAFLGLASQRSGDGAAPAPERLVIRAVIRDAQE